MPLLHLRIFFSFPTRRLFKVMLMLNAVPLGLGLQHQSRSGVGPRCHALATQCSSGMGYTQRTNLSSCTECD